MVPILPFASLASVSVKNDKCSGVNSDHRSLNKLKAQLLALSCIDLNIIFVYFALLPCEYGLVFFDSKVCRSTYINEWSLFIWKNCVEIFIHHQCHLKSWFLLFTLLIFTKTKEFCFIEVIIWLNTVREKTVGMQK